MTKKNIHTYIYVDLVLLYSQYICFMWFIEHYPFSPNKKQCSFYPSKGRKYNGLSCVLLRVRSALLTEMFYYCEGECEVAMSDGERGIREEESAAAHQAIITRLRGDLRCERYSARMHLGRSIQPPQSLPHIQTQSHIIYFGV